METGLEIRPIKGYSVETIAYIVNLSQQGYPQPFFITTEYMKKLIYQLNISFKHSFLAIKGDRFVGIVLNCVSENEKIAYTFWWGVIPQERNIKNRDFSISTKLAIHAILSLKSENFSCIFCTVLETNKLGMNGATRLGFRKLRRLFSLRMVYPEPVRNICEGIRIEECNFNKIIGLLAQFHKVRQPWERLYSQFKRLDIKQPESFVVVDVQNNEIKGYIVFCVEGRKCIVEDIRCENKEVFCMLLNFMFQKTNCFLIEINSVPEDDNILRFCKDVGFKIYCTYHEMLLVLEEWGENLYYFRKKYFFHQNKQL